MLHSIEAGTSNFNVFQGASIISAKLSVLDSAKRLMTVSREAS